MVQYPKDQIRKDIVHAALEIFARKGFVEALVAEIAKTAGVSTGNIYRYFTSKEDLFHAVITDDVAERLSCLIDRKVKSLDGIGDIRELAPTADYHLISEELLNFCIQNRLRVVVLLSKSSKTRYENYGVEMVDSLKQLAAGHFRTLYPHFQITETMQFNLDKIYQNFVDTVVDILAKFSDENDIRRAVAGFLKYHLVGLKSFFEYSLSSTRSGGSST